MQVSRILRGGGTPVGGDMGVGLIEDFTGGVFSARHTFAGDEKDGCIICNRLCESC